MITEETKIVDCNLSIYIKNKLIDAKIETIKDILQYDVTYLMRFRGFGRKSISEIVHFININGFNFNN